MKLVEMAKDEIEKDINELDEDIREASQLAEKLKVQLKKLKRRYQNTDKMHDDLKNIKLVLSGITGVVIGLKKLRDTLKDK